MRLLLRRSQRAGALTGSMIFCIDARVEFTPPEKANVQRYRLGGQVIYNSEASKRALNKSDAAQDGSMRGSLKGLAFVALAAMKLNISVASLERGQHIECKSLDELLGAEEAILEACQNLRGYLDSAATFDGREVVLDFSTGEPKVVAQAAASMPVPGVGTATRPPTPTPPDPTDLPPRPAQPPPVAPTHEMQDGEAVPIARATAPRPAYDPARPNKKPAREPIPIEPEARTLLLLLGAVAVVVLCAHFFISRL